MKRTEPQSLADVMRLTLEENRMQNKLMEQSALTVWPEIVGAHIASMCANPRVANGIITIHVANTALRHELSMSRSSLTRLINSRLGKEVISDIRFTS